MKKRGAIFAIILMALSINFASAATYYISPSGSDTTGNGNYTSPWAGFSRAYSSMIGGDTLIVKNGTYTGQQIITRWTSTKPPSGNASAWTTIRAEYDGGAILDGQGNLTPISMGGSPVSPVRYIQVRGLVFRHQGGGADLYDASFLKFFRCGFEDAADGNSAVIGMGRYTHDILFEECYSWGSGRYKFLVYHGDRIIFRRCVARFDRANPNHDGRTEPVATFAVYASTNVEVQNCISIDGDHYEFWIKPIGDHGGAYYIPSTDGPATNITIEGSISLKDLKFQGVAKNLDNVTVRNCVAWDLNEGVWARDAVSYEHCTFGNFSGPAIGVPNIGLHFYPGDDPVNSIRVTDSIVYRVNGTAITNFNFEDYNVLYGNIWNYSNTPQGAHTIFSSNPNLRYIPRIESDNAVLHGTASDGGDKGANILKKIGVSGTLWGEPGYNQVTNDNLWPWPYESTIKRDFKSYTYTGPRDDNTTGTLSGNRGFASDGNGLYGGPITLTSYIWEYLGNPCPSEICNYTQTNQTQNQTNQTVYHDSDLNQNSYIETSEIMNYISRFKTGNVTRTDVLIGVRNWLLGRYA